MIIYSGDLKEIKELVCSIETQSLEDYDRVLRIIEIVDRTIACDKCKNAERVQEAYDLAAEIRRAAVKLREDNI